MITAGQMRAARALLGLDQRALAELSGLSLPTIQRMEASDGVIRGNVDSLMKLVGALHASGIELIAEGAASMSGRARRPAGRGDREPRAHDKMWWRGSFWPYSRWRLSAWPPRGSRSGVRSSTAAGLIFCAVLLFAGSSALIGPIERLVLPLGPALDRHPICGLDAWSGFFLVLVGLGGGGASLYAIGYGRHETHPGRVLAILSGVPGRVGPRRGRRRRVSIPVLPGN